MPKRSLLHFFDSVLPWFSEGLRREKALLQSGKIHYPSIRVPLSEHDSRVVWSLMLAFENLARTDPAKVTIFLDMLPPDGAPALLMHLRAITANGKVLAERLPALLACDGVFDIGDDGCKWLAFANAAKAAFSFLSDEGRQAIEDAVLSHRPELTWAKEYLGRAKDGGANPSLADPDGYVRHQLTLAGQNEPRS